MLYLPIFHVISGGGLDPSAKQTSRYSLSTWNIFGGLRILTFFGITEIWIEYVDNDYHRRPNFQKLEKLLTVDLNLEYSWLWFGCIVILRAAFKQPSIQMPKMTRSKFLNLYKFGIKFSYIIF